MAEVEAHEYRLGSPASSIVGIAEGLLQRDDLNDELVTRLRAIRDLALEMCSKPSGLVLPVPSPDARRLGPPRPDHLPRG